VLAAGVSIQPHGRGAGSLLPQAQGLWSPPSSPYDRRCRRVQIGAVGSPWYFPFIPFFCQVFHDLVASMVFSASV
jgi:hypothetical protein